MRLTIAQRRMGLGCALVLTVAVTTVFGDNERQPSEASVAAEPALPVKDSSAPEPQATVIALDKLNRVPPASEGIDLFATKSWTPPPPVQVQAKPAVPPKPTAPPLPFGYVGQLEGKDGLLVFLTRGADMLSIKSGEELGTEYRLESVTPEMVTFVYLPLGERQTLATGGK